MSEPVISPDGKWMWTGNEWIPAPPNTDPDDYSPKENRSSNDFTNTNEKSEKPVKQLIKVNKSIDLSEFEKEVNIVKNAVPNANEDEIIEAFVRSRDEFNVKPKDALIGIIEFFQIQTKSGIKIDVNPDITSSSHSSSDSNKIESSIGPKPKPPDSSENGIDNQPCSANNDQAFASKSSSDFTTSSLL